MTDGGDVRGNRWCGLILAGVLLVGGCAGTRVAADGTDVVATTSFDVSAMLSALPDGCEPPPELLTMTAAPSDGFVFSCAYFEHVDSMTHEAGDLVTDEAYPTYPQPTYPTVDIPDYVGPYDWVNHGAVSDAADIALVKGMSPEEVLTLLSGPNDFVHPLTEIGPAAEIWDQYLNDPDPRQGAETGPEQAYVGYAQVIEARTVGEWTLVIEDNGFQSSFLTPELSAEGEAYSIFWNVNADMSFAYSRAGVLMRSFDPLGIGETNPGTGDPLPEEAALGLRDGFLMASLPRAFILMESRTGITLTADDISMGGDGLAVIVGY